MGNSYNAGIMTWIDSRGATTQAQVDQAVASGVRHLKRNDEVMARLIDRFGPYQLKFNRNYFQLMVGTVISQQLSTKAAKTIYDRVVDAIGGGSPKPAAILGVSEQRLRECGLSRSKATFVKNVATAFEEWQMGPKRWAQKSDDEVMELMTSIKGIGPWSAQMFLMFALCRLDVFPIGDLSMRNAMIREYGLRKKPSDRRLEKIADGWRPYRTVGALYLWQSVDG